MDGPGDLGFEAALAAVVARRLAADPRRVERVGLAELAGRRPVETVVASHDLPGCDNSAMDGFAVRASGTPGRLGLIGEARAGSPFEGSIRSSEAVAVSTGAALPDGADAVVPVERAAVSAGGVEVAGRAEPGDFVRRAGSDVEAGQAVLAAGARVTPAAVAAVAAAGVGRVAVAPRPRVGLVTTGDELVDAGRPRRADQVVDAAAPGLAAQIAAAGGEVVATARVGDDPAAAAGAVAEVLGEPGAARVDLLVTVGGVSVGPHDHLRSAFAAATVEPVFWGVAMTPGHPLWFGVRGAQRVLGLPGNPVSASVCFHVFGRAVLGPAESWDRAAPLAAEIGGPRPRTRLVRCRWRDGALDPLARQESHQVTSLAGAEALALVPAGTPSLGAGASVRYQPFG